MGATLNGIPEGDAAAPEEEEVAEKHLAAISFTGSSTGLVLTDQNTWYQVVSFDTDNASRGSFTANSANDRITIAQGFVGVTEIEWFFGFTIDANSQDVEVGVSQDGGSTIMSPIAPRRAGTGADVGAAAMKTSLSINAVSEAKQLTLWARNITSGADTLTISECYLQAKEA